MRFSSIARCLVAVVVVCFVSIGFAGEAQRKLDLELRLLSSGRGTKSKAMVHPKTLARASRTGNVRVLIRHNGTAQDLRDLGYHVTSQVGRIAAAVVPVDRLAQLADLETVEYIEASRLMALLNDIAVPAVGGTAVREQYDLTGEGVIVGVLDSGIDWRHADFRKPNGKTRIKCILDLSDPGDPDGDGYLNGDGPYGGTLYTEAQINDALEGNGTVRQVDRHGHGTHVTGCAAGNGLSSGAGTLSGTYAGVSPEADIIVVKSRYGDLGSVSSFEAVNALDFFDDQATALAKPIVVNFSYGGHAGAHDGTRNDELAIDSFVGLDRLGRVVVVAAGNEGQDRIHIDGSLNGGSADIQLEIPAYIAKSGGSNDVVLLDLWYPGEADLSFTLTTPSGLSYGPVSSGEFVEEVFGADGTVAIYNAKDGPDASNQDNNAQIFILDYLPFLTPRSGTWELTVTGSAERYDLWLVKSSMNASLVDGDTSHTVGMPGTAKRAITVGGWVSRKSWIDIDGVPISDSSLVLGTAYASSSIGPSADGRMKPEVCAPAQWIVSTLSDEAWPGSTFSMWPDIPQQPGKWFVSEDGTHAAASGTSMAAPLVAGGIALMLQQDPSASAAAIRDKLTSTATSDEFTGQVPNDRWGYGKVDFDKACSSDPSASTLMPLPEFESTYGPSAGTRGYWFEAPVDFTITGLRVPDESGQGTQNVEVVRFDNQTPPPVWSSDTNAFESLVRLIGQPSETILAVNIPVSAGDVIGVLGAAGTTSMYNSYGTGDFTSSIGGHSMTLTRIGMSVNLYATAAHDVYQGPGGNIGRVELWYTTGENPQTVVISGQVYREYRANEVEDESDPGYVADTTITWWYPPDDSPGAVEEECPSPGGEVTADSQGNYHLAVPYGWSGKIVGVKEGFGVGELHVTNITDNQALNIPLYREPILRLSGYVYEGNSWTGIAGATVQTTGIYSTSTQTDSNGHYSLDVPYGYYGCVEASKSGYWYDYRVESGMTSNANHTFRLTER